MREVSSKPNMTGGWMVAVGEDQICSEGNIMDGWERGEIEWIQTLCYFIHANYAESMWTKHCVTLIAWLQERRIWLRRTCGCLMGIDLML